MKTNIGNIQKEWTKGQFAPVYLFYGEEDFLIKRYEAEIKKKALEPGEDDFNLDIFYANEADGAKIINAASSYPIMATRRVVIARNIEQLSATSMQILAKYVQKPSETTCLVLTARKIDTKKKALNIIKKESQAIEFKSLYENQVPDWIRTYLKEQKLTIADDAVRLLHTSTGNSLRSISSEIEKIKLNLGERSNIELEDVESVVGISKQFNVFELCDAVGKRNIKSSLHILSNMLQLGEQPVVIMTMLSRHFQILMKVKELKARKTRDDEIAKSLRIHPFFLKNYAQQSARFNRTQFDKAFQLLLEADKHLKSSYQKPKLILETLLFRLNLL